MNAADPRTALHDAADRNGEATALIASGTPITYRTLAREVDALAVSMERVLARSPAPQVAIALGNDLGYVVWLLACVRIGAIAMPVPPDLPADELERLCANGGVGYAVGPSSAARGEPLLSAFGASLRATGSARSHDVPDPGDVLLRQFSSGSGGDRKQMLKSAANIAHDVWHFRRTLGLADEVNMLGVLPLQHAYGALALWVSLLSGGTLVLEHGFLPGATVRTLIASHVDVVLATPPMLDLLARAHPGADEAIAFERVRYCICSAGHLGPAIYDAFSTRFDQHVTVQYGSTETLSTAVDLSGEFMEGRVGRPYDEVQLRIVDERNAPVPVGIIGRVAVRSAAASAGYEGDPRASMRTFVGGWVLPGDRGLLDEAGRLHVIGRDDVLNVGGRKVDRAQLEQALRALPGVDDVVAAVCTRDGRDVLAAIIESTRSDWNALDLRRALAPRFASVEIPAIVVAVKRLPRDATGKVRMHDVIALIT